MRVISSKLLSSLNKGDMEILFGEPIFIHIEKALWGQAHS
jgi:hypothetical protein